MLRNHLLLVAGSGGAGVRFVDTELLLDGGGVGGGLDGSCGWPGSFGPREGGGGGGVSSPSSSSSPKDSLYMTT